MEDGAVQRLGGVGREGGGGPRLLPAAVADQPGPLAGGQCLEYGEVGAGGVLFEVVQARVGGGAQLFAPALLALIGSLDPSQEFRGQLFVDLTEAVLEVGVAAIELGPLHTGTAAEILDTEFGEGALEAEIDQGAVQRSAGIGRRL